FVMGSETDDWSFRGREIIGSNNGGASFTLGNQLAPGSPTASTSIMEFLKQLFGNWDTNWRPNDYGSNPYYDPIFGNRFDEPRPYACGLHQRQMEEMFGALSDMFDALSRLTNMNETFFANRNRALMV
ncbi:MAG: hypothetical protein OEQ28_15515, partial [Acidobacteriota bacterium]|nr:hypothetical protein [Acidobacteriota bacterium]